MPLTGDYPDARSLHYGAFKFNHKRKDDSFPANLVSFRLFMLPVPAVC